MVKFVKNAPPLVSAESHAYSLLAWKKPIQMFNIARMLVLPFLPDRYPPAG